jgi:hypothetical protein
MAVSDTSPRVAVVTGASSGIGLYTALGLARDGMRVIMTGRNHERTETARSTRFFWLLQIPRLAHYDGLFVEPYVFPSLKAEDAVDHHDLTLDVWPHAGAEAGVKDDRPRVLLDQFAPDLPQYLLPARRVDFDLIGPDIDALDHRKRTRMLYNRSLSNSEPTLPAMVRYFHQLSLPTSSLSPSPRPRSLVAASNRQRAASRR